MKTITAGRNDNLILFPKTVEYYQVELTQLLEQERYRDAAALLRFLLECRTEDQQTYEEWLALAEWLKENTSAKYSQLDDAADLAEEDLTEEQMHKRYIQRKTEQDGQYVKRWLDTLLQETALDKKMLALDQLAYVEHPQIDDTLIRWLENVDLHPMVQFKVLQTLKRRDAQGKVSMFRCGEQVQVDIDETPLVRDDFPAPLISIIDVVCSTSEISDPSLAFFANQIWNEFLSFIYGTSIYKALAEADEPLIAVWASALHQASTNTMLGPSESIETKSQYGIEARYNAVWEQSYKLIKQFVESAFRPIP